MRALEAAPRSLPPSLAFAAAFGASIVVAGACGSRTELFGAGPTDAAATDSAPAQDAPADVQPDVQPGMPCHSDADCADHRFCTMSARCDPVRGCVLTPRTCDDAVACTDDTCNEKKKQCEHRADDTKCPDDQLCSVARGCYPFVYGVASDQHLYEVRVPTGDLADVGSSPAFASDLALAPDGTLYSTDSYVLYATDRGDASTRAVGSILPLHMYNGLGARPDGTLQATADVPEVLGVDTMTAAASPIASLVAGYRASGDLTTVAGTLYVTLTPDGNPTTDTLGLVDLNAQTTTVVGDTGIACIWGLATLGGAMFGLTCNGQLVSIDPATAKAKVLAQTQPAFFGAAAR
jgi:hypothetical protein